MGTRTFPPPTASELANSSKPNRALSPSSWMTPVGSVATAKCRTNCCWDAPQVLAPEAGGELVAAATQMLPASEPVDRLKMTSGAGAVTRACVAVGTRPFAQEPDARFMTQEPVVTGAEELSEQQVETNTSVAFIVMAKAAGAPLGGQVPSDARVVA